ncbi:IS3 family transposase [Rhodococcus aetherivorans]|uniref:IS3 family transposase n=1 Tax=Rhodococcus aetherivorans TaxID=191292 RepID=UPI002899A6F8|nr:IS3 family transposase [Rhodococcus aetherivorans]
MADWADSEVFPVEFMCRELGVSRSGYYAWRARPISARELRDEDLTARIRVLHEQGRGNPGVRRIRAGLRAQGIAIGLKRVWRLMKAAGLQGRHPRSWKKTTITGEKPVAAPDLIGRNFTAEEPNTRWCGDITYIKTWQGWCFLATVIDLHSRKVVGFAVADHMRTSLVTDALSMAIVHRAPPAGVIFHSDRGTQ